MIDGSGCDFVLYENPVSIFYLTRVSLSSGMLIQRKQEKKLFVDGRYWGAAKKIFDHTELMTDENIFRFLSKENKGRLRIGFESDFCSYDRVEELRKKFSSLLNNVEFIPLSRLLEQSRMYKTSEEISLMKEAASIAYRGYQHVQKLLCPGISEKEAAWAFESFCRKHGADALSFEPIVAFGEHSAYPHHLPTDRLLKKEDGVLFDCGVKYCHYCSDMTRMFFLEKAPKVLLECYEIVKKAFYSGLQQGRIGRSIRDIDEAVHRVIREYGYEQQFLHSTGHGIGLEIHEPPRINAQKEDATISLQKNMVFTIEPGIYLEGMGGVRYEDTVYMTAKGIESFYPKDYERNG
ncbi:MAG: aminopeptidase P family protein [Parachlamydiales bacterium]|nr:aminopeptidase P family protein [Parachlamydiales bacterium]